MTVSLRDYDFAAARQRLAARVDVGTRMVRDERGEYDFERTRLIRELTEGVDDVLGHLEILLVAALCELPVAEGGLVIGAQALATAMSPDQPLVRALLILGAHPSHPGFEHRALAASGRSVPNEWRNTPHDAGPFLAKQPRATWSVGAFEAAVQEGAVAVFGAVQVDPNRLTFEQAPGSKLGAYLRILAASSLYDAIGAWAPTFSARDALVGEWWLLQPTSPRLEHDEVAAKVGLQLRGFLPPANVDAKGRVVMVCFPRTAMSDEARVEEIGGTKWISGWRRVVWTASEAPAALVDELEGITKTSYGPYKHSSELPEFAQTATPAQQGKARAQAFAQAVLDELDAPEDANAAALEAQNDRRKAKIAEASYLRTKQVKPKPPRVFVGPGRTLDELAFAASLEFCPTCNDRIAPGAKLRDLGAGTWEVAGPCSRCKEQRSYRYAAAPDVAHAPHAEHELGAGPSKMITAQQFTDALAEALPQVAPGPERLDDEDRGLSPRRIVAPSSVFTS
ncbi:MAG: hypothetical protein IPQ07_28200 [Myxococcales bacterium]|nr:hypothetical protein [Myxococcales bacterium]